MNSNRLHQVLAATGLVTPLLVIANVIVYLFEGAAGASWLDVAPETQVAWGGNLAVLTFTGEPWRLLTSMFLHAGLLHVAMNMYMLALIGVRAEHRFGRLGMLALYLCGGLLASCASALWLGHHAFHVNILGWSSISFVVSLGASGAIMATCGALLAAMALDHASGNADLLEPGFGKALAQVVAINLAMGLIVKDVDQAAHIGGVVAGLIVGSARMPVALTAQALRLAAAVLVTAACVWGALRGQDDEEMRDLRSQYDQMASEQREAADAEALKAARVQGRERDRVLPAPVAADDARGRVIEFGASGQSFVLSSDETKAYVVDHAKNQIDVIDLATASVERRIDGPAVAAERLTTGYCHTLYCGGPAAADIAVLEDKRLALVTSMHENAVDFIDLAAGRIVRTLPVGQAPDVITLAPDRKRAYVYNAGDHTVAVIDIDAGTVLARLPFPSDTRPDFAGQLTMWFDADGSRLYVHDATTNQRVVIDTAKLAIDDSNFLPAQVYELALPRGRSDDLFGLASSGIYRMDRDGTKIREMLDFCNGFGGDSLAVVATGRQTGRFAFASTHNAPENDLIVSIVNLDSLVTIGRYPVAGMVTKLQFSADGKKLYVLTVNGKFIGRRTGRAHVRGGGGMNLPAAPELPAAAGAAAA
jgi:rhomboid protease GluP